MSHRIVITGMGMVTPVGHDVESVWKALLSGQSGSALTTAFDASTFPTKFSAEVKNYNLRDHISSCQDHCEALKGTSFVLGAAAQACRQAGIDTETDSPCDNIDRARLGVYLGAGEGSVDNDTFFESIEKSWDNENGQMDWPKWTAYSNENMRAYRELEQEPSMPSAHLAIFAGARGVVRSCLTACAASTQAIGEAAMLIRRGDADIMLAGGCHSMIHPLGVTGFNLLTALSRRNDSPETASRPFTATRDGFVLGEGGAVLVLESLESAKRRNAAILAEITGFGSSCDAFRVTDMHEDARGGTAAIIAALKDAGITNQDVDYINAHGTSTKENDSIETKAIKNAFGENAYKTPVSSVKSTLGHLIGAAGASELITCIKAIETGIIPPTANYNDPDPELDLDYVPNEPRKQAVVVAVNESFGFGGQNDVVIVQKYQE
ncbi:3-oxoacyl-[acyl-carrier-protein] synthase 2 [Limihaloglobus sulfuriphilus]|uniref:3-oxoacyl-[acyl-carrier-protein] synthase 2 n=1 Tax=Limihaloglobus sulfuriphilus TaxID=1851148 RepID=A0A1Q2ME03_9BACT|nr:beta-ketoacyl-ACP synthase II [Limihaloglobus sulfuriphilus]AQQ70874.1 3-oxoacyl-[acyl-carrier-protein] synthase 2 [Limihaloglobus sulfuriphilus]